MKKSRSIIILLVLVVLATVFSGACRKKGESAILTASAQKIYKKDWKDVWKATLAVLTDEMGLRLHIAQEDTGLIQTYWEEFEKSPTHFREAEDLEFGHPKIVAQYKISAVVKITLEGTLVRVKKNEREFQSFWRNVPTDLTVEREILDRITRRLGLNELKPLPSQTYESGLDEPIDTDSTKEKTDDKGPIDTETDNPVIVVPPEAEEPPDGDEPEKLEAPVEDDQQPEMEAQPEVKDEPKADKKAEEPKIKPEKKKKSKKKEKKKDKEGIVIIPTE